VSDGDRGRVVWGSGKNGRIERLRAARQLSKESFVVESCIFNKAFQSLVENSLKGMRVITAMGRDGCILNQMAELTQGTESQTEFFFAL